MKIGQSLLVLLLSTIASAAAEDWYKYKVTLEKIYVKTENDGYGRDEEVYGSLYVLVDGKKESVLWNKSERQHVHINQGKSSIVNKSYTTDKPAKKIVVGGTLKEDDRFKNDKLGTKTRDVTNQPGSFYEQYKDGRTRVWIYWNVEKILVKGSNPQATGDPHFETWSGEKYDFHGGCDLVLLQNNNFANGLGMNIHIRTSIRTWWSFIESAILQIGENTLQITGGIGSSTYSINGAKKTELVTGDAALGDFAIRFRRVNDHHTITRIDLGNHGDAIGIETFKDFVKVNVKNVKNTNFEGSLGMLGSYPDGKKVGRDGKTIFEDANAFGQEWMVKPSDNVLFQDVDVSVLPLQCTMPDLTSMKEGRRLGEGSISEGDAAIACSRVDQAHRDACIFDVLATMDLDMAGSY